MPIRTALTRFPRPSPTGLNRLALAVTTLALVLAALVTGAVTAQPAGATSTEDGVTSRLNGARTAHGLPALTTRGDLTEVARAQAGRMAESWTLFHNPNLTTDVTGWRYVGENVGYGPDTETVHAAFMGSPGHRANILDSDYTELGVGVVERDGRVWVVEVFRQPQRTTTTSTSGPAPFLTTLRTGSQGDAVRRVQGPTGPVADRLLRHEDRDRGPAVPTRTGLGGQRHRGPRHLGPAVLSRTGPAISRAG